MTSERMQLVPTVQQQLHYEETKSDLLSSSEIVSSIRLGLNSSLSSRSKQELK
jgi:hypothetical protein